MSCIYAVYQISTRCVYANQFVIMASRGGGGGGGSTVLTTHSDSVVGEWTHVSNAAINQVTAIREVTESLSPLKGRWVEVGKLFKLNPILEDIRKKHEGDHEKCLREIVDKWLSSGCNPSWQLLAKTIASIDPCVSDAIARKHSSGKDEKPDLNDLMNAVAAKINHKWQEVGIQLGLKHNELKSFQQIHQNPLEIWREIFTTWKRRADDNYKYCLATMFSALTSNEVDEKEVAKDYYKNLQELHRLNSKYAEMKDEKLSSSDLRVFTNKVGHRVKDSWRPIGSELGLSVTDLKSISISHPNSPGDCIRDVFSKWTRSLTKEPVTWQTLLVSLCKPQVDLKEIADEVADDFRSGKLYSF